MRTLYISLGLFHFLFLDYIIGKITLFFFNTLFVDDDDIQWFDSEC